MLNVCGARTVGGFLVAGWLAIAAPAALGQGYGNGDGSLGGYGGAIAEMGGTPGMSGPVIPYAGKFGGFMPYRMGGGGLSFSSRGTGVGGGGMLGSGRTSFRLAPAAGSMPAMSGGLGGASAFGGRGLMNMGGGLPLPSGMRPMGVMPPRFGYPFRQPPSLVPDGSPSMGMSM